jgi:hypothetical protein
MHRLTGALVFAAIFAASAPAWADEPSPAQEWSGRYEHARRLLVEGDYRHAETAFLDLAVDAPTDIDRRLAAEMARLAALSAAREEATIPPPDAATESGPRIRTRDEITLLYATSFLYGAGTGTWFLLQAQPGSAFTATLPFIGITAAPVVAVAVIDGNHPLPHGMPHAIAQGIYVGLGEGILAATYQHARAHREDEARWKPEEVSSVLWGGATLGGVVGGTISAALPTTPGRASYIASATVWGGVLTGFTTGALLPDTAHRTETSLLAADAGYNLSLVTGMLTASTVSPTVARVRIVDLCGVAGGFLFGGTYLAAAQRGTDSRATLGLAAIGAAGGLTLGWFSTTKMTREVPSTPAVSFDPTLLPVSGGAMAGVTGVIR